LPQGIATAERVFRDPTILDRPSLRHEAILLLKKCFAQLSAETQQNILAWMDAGPSEESIRRFLEFVGESVTDENVSHVKNIRRRDRFVILDGQLPESYQRIYEELTTKLGPPTPPEQLPIRTFGAIGAPSPKSAVELAAMTVEDVIGFLTSWKPGTDIFAPTVEGLGVALTSTVSQRSAEFVAASDFKMLDPTYVRSFFAGLSAALENGRKFDWKPVLELATWVSTQPRSIAGRKGGLMVADPDWGWTRDSVIDLLKAGFEGGNVQLQHAAIAQYAQQLRLLTIGDQFANRRPGVTCCQPRSGRCFQFLSKAFLVLRTQKNNGQSTATGCHPAFPVPPSRLSSLTCCVN
jgi:hypothetical protein